MSVTWNSSKQSSQASCASSIAASSDRILAGVLAEFHLLPERMNALVHVDHEFVEMRAALAHDRARLEEQIHQHGLAASDIAVDVKALDRRLPFSRLPNSQPSEDDLRASRCSTIRASSRASMSTTASCAASRSILPAATPAAYRAVMELAMFC